MNEITLKEFIATEIKFLNEFKDWWLEMVKEEPEHYPLTQSFEDWEKSYYGEKAEVYY